MSDKDIQTQVEESIVLPDDIDVSFDTFPYFLSDTVKEFLISSTYLHLDVKFKDYATELIKPLQTILLLGPAEIYVEALAKALAKHFGARLLILDALTLPNGTPLMDDDPYPVCDEIDYGGVMEKILEAAFENIKNGALVMYIKNMEKSVATQRLTLNNKFSCLPPNMVAISYINSVATNIKQVSSIFSTRLTIDPPQDRALLSVWKEQLKGHFQSQINQSTIANIQKVLKEIDFECLDLQNITVEDQVLEIPDVTRIVGWATNHHFMKLAEGVTTDTNVLISADSIKYGLDLLHKVKRENKILKKSQISEHRIEYPVEESPKDVVIENEYERDLLKNVIRPSEIGVTFNDIGALENLKNLLDEVVTLPLRRPELFGHGQLTKSSCKGVLLFGPPGTGKTMLAKAMATEAGAAFINITAGVIASKYLGETSKYVKALFSLARKLAPSIIFIDEADSILGGKQREFNESGAWHRMKCEFLINWDGLKTRDDDRVLVLCATNRPFDLDDAVIRRLPRRFMVDLPDAINRRKILEAILAQEELAPDVHLNALANKTAGYSGSDLKNLCVTAANRRIREIIKNQKALAKNNTLHGSLVGAKLRVLCMSDFLDAYKKIWPSVPSNSVLKRQLAIWNSQYGEDLDGSKKGSKKGYFLRD